MADLIQRLSLLLIAGYFLFLVLSLTRRGKVITGPWLFLMRSFFPNWRFYHGAGSQPRLFWRTANDQGAWSTWTMFMPRAHRSWRDLLHNARNNLTLADQNLIDHLSADLSALPDDADVRALVTYQMVQRLTHWLIAREGMTAAKYQFQLRLVPVMTAMTGPDALPGEADAVLTSPALDW